MLSLMRKHAASGIIKVILGLIVIVFVFWGFEGFRADRSGSVAVVNGEVITMDEYRQAYNNLVERYRQQYGGQLDEEVIEMLQLRRQALDSLVNQKLMESEAGKLDLRVSDQELSDYIRNVDIFQIEGVFDSGRYRDILARMRITPEQFEQQQRTALLVQKLRDLIISNVKVSDAEAMEFYNWFNTSVKIKYAAFDPRRYETDAPDPETLNAYFEENKEAFRLKPKRKVRYAHFNPEDYADKVVLSDQDIKEDYEQRIAEGEFTTEETVEARHILIMVDVEADEKIWEEKYHDILDLLERARGGEDFAELAMAYSEDVSSGEQGGYLGVFGRGSMVEPFENVAFSTKAGEISDPVRTPFGWHIIKVENVNEAATLTLDEAREQIQTRLIEVRSKAMAYDDAEAVYQMSFESDDLIAAAEKSRVPLMTTDFFSDEGPPEIPVMLREKFGEIAFSLYDGEISDINEMVDGYYIIQLIGIQKARVPEFEEVKERVQAEWTLAQQEATARQNAQNFHEKMRSGISMEDMSGEFDVVVSETDFFKRHQSIPDLGYEPVISDAAFGLSSENRYTEEILRGNEAYYVIAFLDRKEPDMDDFEKEKDTIRQRLIYQKQMKTFEDWMTQVRVSGKISINENLFSS